MEKRIALALYHDIHRTKQRIKSHGHGSELGQKISVRVVPLMGHQFKLEFNDAITVSTLKGLIQNKSGLMENEQNIMHHGGHIIRCTVSQAHLPS